MVSFQELADSTQEGSFLEVCGELSSTAEIMITVMLVVNDVTTQQGTDFFLSTSILTFQPGETQSCAEVMALEDPTLEDDEEFTLRLESNLNALVQVFPIAETRVTILNQDSMLKIT